MRGVRGSKKAFTLVELIIVITILAILATIAFMSFQNFSKDARNGNRVVTLKSIEKGIDLYAIKNTTLPIPEGVTTQVMGSGSTSSGILLWTKGELGDEISRKILLNKTPKDPNNKNQNYIYAVTPAGEYQVATILENLQAKAKVSGYYTPRFFETDTTRYFVPSLIFTGTGYDIISQDKNNLKLNDPDTEIYYVTDDDTNLPYDIGSNTSANKPTKDLELVQDIINKVKDKSSSGTTKEQIEQYFTQTGTGKTENDPIYDSIKETTGSSSSQSSNQDTGNGGDQESGNNTPPSTNCPFDECLENDYFVIKSDNTTYTTGCNWSTDKQTINGTEYDKTKCILKIVGVEGGDIYVAPSDSDTPGSHWNSDQTSTCTSATETCNEVKSYDALSVLTSTTSGYAVDYCNQLHGSRYLKNVPLPAGTTQWFLPPRDAGGLQTIQQNIGKVHDVGSSPWYWSSSFKGWLGDDGSWFAGSLDGYGSTYNGWYKGDRRVRCIAK